MLCLPVGAPVRAMGVGATGRFDGRVGGTSGTAGAGRDEGAVDGAKLLTAAVTGARSAE
jgi:hypothetical protein